MKKIALTITLLLTIILYSQNMEFKVGTEYRITPIQELSKSPLPIAEVRFSQHNQLTGTAFNYSVGYLTKNGFGFGFSQSFQYSHIYYEQTENDIEKSVNGLITDFKLFIKQEFEIKNKLFFIEVGGSLMNNGTSYLYKEEVPIGNNEYGIGTDDKDFLYTALNLAISYTYNKFDIGIGMYFTKGYLVAIKREAFKLPYFNMNYRIY